ncbi:hypothetical protein J2W36_004634 [Variovorax ginsengisoli]|uniref:Uncharacterized protein n=1 Tax=Variovorax ginsengisoli TaxID=363844 RepID=A0ABT9SG48_9BURK|nr:hypothetical protein [Variovorax ginsengisoli]
MNLHPPVNDPGGPLAPADWTITVSAEIVGAVVHYFADVRRSGTQVCRLSIIGTESEEEARSRLALKARLWIDDYLSRSRSGNTGCGP